MSLGTTDAIAAVVNQLLLELLPSAPRHHATLRQQGLDSMGAARLWLELRATLDVDLPLEWLATEADPAGLVARIAKEQASGTVVAADRLQVSPDLEHRNSPFPLTPMQESYVFGTHAELTDDPVGCDQYLEIEIRDLDIERLRRAWQRLVDSHDMLRSIVTADGAQRVLAGVPPVAIAVRDLTSLTPEVAMHAIAEVRQRFLSYRRAAGERPPFVLEVSLRRPLALVHLHIDMVVTDGHGLALLLDQWRACYDDEAHVLPDPGITARDCVLALAAQSRTEAYRNDLEWWAETLRRLPAGPLLPAVKPGPKGFIRRALEGAITESAWRALRERAEAMNVSASALVLALFARALGERQGQAFSLVVTTNLRALLPVSTDAVVGPFTSAAIVVARDPRQAIEDSARDLQQQLWDALRHSTVSSVTALRHVRSRERSRPPVSLPVVFTSLVGVGPGGHQDRGFGADMTFAMCRTSEVALEHQIWEHGGGLRYRWDVAVERFPDGATETLFSAFERSLQALCAATETATVIHRPLNELQQAYYVARASAPGEAWNGCQIYESFEAADLDPRALERSLAWLVERHEALRTVMTADGHLEVQSAAPARWSVPVIEIESAAELAAIRDEMAGRAFPLGVWPPFDVRVTRCGGKWTVHCAFDLAVVDARSVHLLCRELFAPHRRRSATESVTLPMAPASYWDERLAQLPPGPSLPASENRRRMRLSSRMSGWNRLAQLASRHEVTPDALLLAAFLEVLAARLCHRAFAVPVVRFPVTHEGARPGEYTALSWVERAGEGSPEERAAAYQRLLIADAAAERTSGLGALRRRILRARGDGDFAFPVVYTTIIDLSDAPLPPAIAQGEWLSCTPDVSLDCIGVREGDDLFFAWDAVEADFPPGLLPEMFEDYRALLERLARDPFTEDRDRILYGWNDTATSFPRERRVHQFFEERAAERPEGIALRGRGWTRTYGELNREANRIAWHLKAQGAGPETVVGVAISRGPAMVAACLGILKAGSAYLPVEPSLPAERAAMLLSEARAAILLAMSASVPWEVPHGTRIVYVDRDPAGEPAENPPPSGTAENLAYVIFTSGSTGKPKGVAVAHRAVVNLLHWCYRTFAFGPTDTGLCVTPLGFDLSVFDIFGILGCGGTLYVSDEVERTDPQLLLEILVREGITFWNSAPAALSHLAPLLPAARGRSGTTALRLVFLSGDYTPLTLPGDLRATFPGARIVNLGGATEATVWSNFFPVGEVDPRWRSIPYGRPIDNARYHVLDAQLEPCAPGIEGDLYIGGECLSLGYYGKPDLTADRFIPDPFARQPGQRLYRTGDRATYLSDGSLSFLGRSDRQVKIRGFRVELEEIEHRLRQHPAVKDAVVVVRPDPSGDRKLVGYALAASPGSPPAVKALRAFVAQALPDYMVPNHIGFLDAFPMTENGKLDRDALPWPLAGEGATAPAANPHVARLEEEIAAIFAGLLGATRFHPAQDMWDQGATSFTVVQVSNVLHQRYGRRLPISAVVADPTVSGIARWLAAEVASEALPSVPTAEVVAPEPVDYFSDEERRRFKEGQWNLRPRSPREPLVPLPPPQLANEHYLWRSSRRELLAGPVPFDSFCRLLGLLAQAMVGDRARRLYPSAGDTYAVQVYVLVRDGRVEGVAPGIYYYESHDHALQQVRAQPDLDRTVHFLSNRPLFDAAAFELYLVGQTRGIEPIYGENAERYLALEAGHISQLLMMGQAACGLGLCPIGGLAFGRVREQLGLDDGHVFLLSMLGGRAESPTSSTGVTPPFAEQQPADVAIIGMAGRYPGADDPDALWEQLVAGSSAIGQPSPHRDIATTSHGGFLERIDTFDSMFFHISPAEAEILDPQLRLLLETVWECLENAGHTPASLQRAAGRVGVVVGAMWQDYQHVGAEAWERGGDAVVSASASDIAHRVSQCFDFQGPSLAVDAACTSSLAAIHLAVESLRRGECGAVIVGAVNLVGHGYHVGVLSGLGLSAQRIGGAFDADASGWVPGEGVAAMLLRPAAAAFEDGDVIHGVIEATALGHAGHLGAADPHGLARSLERMLSERRLSPRAISYVECAAAGASVGDAAEIEALASLFADPERREPVPVGTLKANIGHLEAAAGLSQLTKVLLQMRHRQMAPTRIAARRNPLVAWNDLPLRIVDCVAPWSSGDAPLRALVNSVGANGSYGHLVVRAAPPPKPAGSQRGEHYVVLSAASRPQLVTLAQRLRDHLAASPSDVADVAYTLQTGRAELAHRLAIPCSDLAALQRGLDAFVQGRPLPVTGAAAAWLRGESVTWQWERPARRISLPTYPFARKAHWVRTAGNDEIEERLLRIYADVSGIAREELDARTPLEQLGLTSLLVTRLNARLERELGPISRTLFYEYQTLAEIAGRLRQRTSTEGEPAKAPRDEPAAGDVAIIGLAGRYPQARDLTELWVNLASGRDCITALPAERRQDGWPVEKMWGGYLDEVDQFDALFFNITPREADLTDPQERLFLEVVWEALDDAGYPRQRLRERHASRVGVWVGSMYNEYPFFGVERSLAAAPVSAGAGLADIANRVSYFFDLRGPSMTVDTLCSSSLTSLHLAVESLRRGECELAIAGGVNLSLHPNKFIEQERHDMPASDHRCRSFGKGGDGFVPGEGVGAVILKPLRAARADGDRIQAVIKATAVNHGGRTSGYMVPNPVAHADVIRAALRSAGVPAATIGYIEAHGTGTELGDPIEINGLEHAFADETPALGWWPIGSVKSSIGHLEGAAGIASLTKVVLQLREKTLVPSLHAEQLNPNIDWEHSPFRVQRQLAEWPAVIAGDGRPLPRRAGISSFGAGGANAHAIIEEFVAPPVSTRPAPHPQLVVLSALDDTRLRTVARSLAELLDRHSPALADLAYTLQVGREHLRERLALVVSDVADLRQALQRFAAGDDYGAIRGRATPRADAVETSDLVALGRAWVQGGGVAWSRLHAAVRPALVSLPSYPFDRRRHWVPWTVTGRGSTAPLFRRTWIPAADESRVAVTGKLLCVFHEGSEAVARELVRKLGSSVILLREGADPPDAPVGIKGWIDLCDLYRRDQDPGSWLARLAMLQRVLGASRGTAVRILHVTSGLQDLEGVPPSLAGARVAGLVRMLHAEQRHVTATTFDIDAPPDAPADAASQIAGELHRGHAAEVCHRAGRRYVPELSAVVVTESVLRLDPAQVYVVTGGTRGLGALVARRLVERGARHVALMGAARSPGDVDREPATPLVRELEQSGAKVMLYRGPLTARAEVDGFLARARGWGDIGGIVHCAGHMSDDRRPFFQRDLGAWRAVYEPKVDGLEVLAEVCACDRPAFFLLFSSVAGTFPELAAGAADYAAANAFLDWFAAHHARNGKPWFRSVAWPSWRGAGSPAPEPPAHARLGLEAVDVEEGLRLLEAVAASPSGGALLSGPRRGAATRPSSPPPERVALVPAWLTELFAESLGTPASALAPDVPFGDLGIESILLTELLQKLEAHLGRSLEPTLLIERPTLASLAAALASPAMKAVSPARVVDGQIAIIGAACRFPGASDLASFWTNLREGRCAIGEVPSSRWSSSSLYQPQFDVGKSISKWGGFVDGLEQFDPAYFQMSDEEATCLDPAVRLMLEGVETCLADAGYAGGELAGRDVGVFAGARVSDYWRRTGPRAGSAGFGSDQNFIAARVAQHLDLAGPCLVVDSACSSSLVAVQLAVRSLLAGETELAFAAGVDVLLDERPYLEFSAARALSPSGRCWVFDERADGFVPGEGCGVLLLKPLDRALRDGDRVRAVIDSVAVNNDGRTVGLTTPNPAAQATVIVRALEQSGLRAEDVAMIEAHGTGTMLGDPIELRALTDAFANHTRRLGICAVGSVKSNIGHLLSAAGMAGLIKVMLSLEHGEIPPTLFCDRPNPRFDFARSPFYPNVTLRPWPDDRPMRAAGVSAFGLGGTNAHLIATALDPRCRAAAPARHPRPSPQFQRRRLWLDREGAVTPPHADRRELVTSILDLQFMDNG